MRNGMKEVLIRSLFFAIVLLLIDLFVYQNTQPFLGILARAVFMALVLTAGLALFDKIRHQ
jgi:hypothetical protein